MSNGSLGERPLSVAEINAAWDAIADGFPDRFIGRIALDVKPPAVDASKAETPYLYN